MSNIHCFTDRICGGGWRPGCEFIKAWARIFANFSPGANSCTKALSKCNIWLSNLMWWFATENHGISWNLGWDFPRNDLKDVVSWGWFWMILIIYDVQLGSTVIGLIHEFFFSEHGMFPIICSAVQLLLLKVFEADLDSASQSCNKQYILRPIHIYRLNPTES